MSKKDGERVNVIVLLLILISVAVLAIVFFYVAKFAGPIQGEVVNENNNIPEKKIYTESEKEMKITECASISNINQKDWCLLDLAKEYDIDKCDNIVQPQFKSYCTAIITQNEGDCEEIVAQNVKDACYISLAQATGKSKLCKKTSREEFCLSLVA